MSEQQDPHWHPANAKIRKEAGDRFSDDPDPHVYDWRAAAKEIGDAAYELGDRRNR